VTADAVKADLRKMGTLKTLVALLGDTSDDVLQYTCIALANAAMDGTYSDQDTDLH
jgi:hypothetical protein